MIYSLLCGPLRGIYDYSSWDLANTIFTVSPCCLHQHLYLHEVSAQQKQLLLPASRAVHVQAGHQGLKLSTLSEMSQQLMATAEKSGLLASSAMAERKKKKTDFEGLFSSRVSRKMDQGRWTLLPLHGLLSWFPTDLFF